MNTEWTKPEGVAWWSDVETDKAIALYNFTKNYPGVVVMAKPLFPTNKNKTGLQITFESQEVFEQFRTARNATAEYQARQTYNEANNITLSMTFS
jgi:hypothetical protein